MSLLKNYKNLLEKKNRNFSLTLSQKSKSMINDIVNKSAEKKFDLRSKNDLTNLTLSDIRKIDKNIRGKYQKQLVKILKPGIKKITDCILNKNELSDFRIGSQCKYKKIYGVSDNKKIKYLKYKNLKSYDLPLTDELLCFSTKPHQDLSNQGFRSSMSLIFYLQLTNIYADTCLMQSAVFKNKAGLLDFDSTDFYSNSIKQNSSKSLNWDVPKAMRPGKIFVMDSITPHNSNEISKIPRVAINIKVQPRSLNYIYKIFHLRKKFKKNFSFNLEALENDIKQCAISANSLNFELSVLYLIQKKFDKAFEAFNRFALSKFAKNKIEKIFAGALYRKSYEAVTKDDVKKVFKKELTYSKLSCADSIIQTLKI